MDKIKNIFLGENIIFAVISNKRKSNVLAEKITVKPVVTGGETKLQAEYFFPQRASHKNFDGAELLWGEIASILPEYKNISIFTDVNDYQILLGKKGNISIKKSLPSKKMNIKPHNKDKNYILRENEPCAFLIALGIMTADGVIKAKMYNKFIQINRYLELISKSIEKLPYGRAVKIVDFGCGKGYLTFALYHYLVNIKSLNAEITGVDLKSEVISECRATAQKIDFNKLMFVCGDIKDIEEPNEIDMVISLHACDTATDEAIIKAIDWKSKIIIAAPCCQHELFGQINNDLFEPVIKHGVLKDKLSAILTDSFRGLALEAVGYDVSILEFTPPEHTAKNVMIRAEYTGRKSKEAALQFERLKKFWQCEPYIGMRSEEWIY